jgi:hypothetical protein
MYNKWLVFFLSANDNLDVYTNKSTSSTSESKTGKSSKKQKIVKSWTEVYDTTLEKNKNIMKIEGTVPEKWSVLLYPPIINDVRNELTLINEKINNLEYEIKNAYNDLDKEKFNELYEKYNIENENKTKIYNKIEYYQSKQDKVQESIYNTTRELYIKNKNRQLARENPKNKQIDFKTTNELSEKLYKLYTDKQRLTNEIEIKLRLYNIQDSRIITTGPVPDPPEQKQLFVDKKFKKLISDKLVENSSYGFDKFSKNTNKTPIENELTDKIPNETNFVEKNDESETKIIKLK